MIDREMPLGWTRCIVACGCALLLGCSTPAGHSAKVASLEKIGFVQIDDGMELDLAVKLLFDTDVDVLTDEGRAAVARIGKSLATVGVQRIRVEGHTDNVGSLAYNTGLSQRRADSVAREFVRSGWNDAAIERRGFGSTKPVSNNGTASGRAQNRRVVIAVQVD